MKILPPLKSDDFWGDQMTELKQLCFNTLHIQYLLRTISVENSRILYLITRIQNYKLMLSQVPSVGSIAPTRR